MFSGLGNLGSFLKQAQSLGGRLEALTQDLKGRRATGSAGGGLVEIEVNGLGEVLGCRIDPKLFEQGDRELIEDLVRGAVNQALAKGKQLHAEAMKSLAGDMPLPGLDEALAKLTGGQPPEGT
ncbi:MAG TPA: YbaB/EbfC family nucleoid-associated protein [Pirellulales bacterium]|nr:YbaB/EbfC family nucleoid-associated protein [Pirellulales bacterium]